MKNFIAAVSLIFVFSLNGDAQTTEIKPRGTYKVIAVERDNKAIQLLQGSNSATRAVTIDSILASPNTYNPPVLYVLSNELFEDGKKHEAAFWFYVAQLRARYDANLCLDKSARQAVSILNNQFGPQINQYAFSNLDSLEATVEKAISFVKENKEAYDHRWINLHGTDAIINPKNKHLTVPNSRWGEIKSKTLEDYSQGFQEFVKSKKG